LVPLVKCPGRSKKSGDKKDRAGDIKDRGFFNLSEKLSGEVGVEGQVVGHKDTQVHPSSAPHRTHRCLGQSPGEFGVEDRAGDKKDRGTWVYPVTWVLGAFSTHGPRAIGIITGCNGRQRPRHPAYFSVYTPGNLGLWTGPGGKKTGDFPTWAVKLTQVLHITQ
jgi:hypothetical protein